GRPPPGGGSWSCATAWVSCPGSRRPASAGDALAAVPPPAVSQLGMDPRRAVAAPGLLMHDLDLLGELGVVLFALRPAGQVGIEGGAGDLQQGARSCHVAPASLLRLDEGIHLHRVSLAKKAVARLRISTSSRSLRFSRRSCASSARSSVVRPPSCRVPASRSACLIHSRTAVSVRSKSRATWPTDRSPRWHNSTISALNSGGTERRGRDFFLAMVSMVGHPSSGEPLMLDVRQSGSGPVRRISIACSTVSLPTLYSSWSGLYRSLLWSEVVVRLMLREQD